jgi:predicted MFS family arabinose efflux permease
MSGDPQTINTRHPFFYGHLLVAAAFFIMVAIWALYYSFGVFFKPILNEFGWSRAMTSGAFSLSSVVSGLTAILMGKLTDRAGPRTVMTLCAVQLGLGFFLMSKIDTVWQIYLVLGIIVGTGMGGSFVPLMSTVARWFVEKRSMMTGIVAAGVSIGTFAGPPVANRLISILGWRTSYAAMGGTVSAIVILLAQILKRDPSEVGQSAYGASVLSGKETAVKAETPSLMSAFRVGQLWMVYAIFFCLGYCAFAVMVHITPYSIDHGTSAPTAAYILATVGGGGIIGRIVLGRLADFIGNKKAMMVGFILMTAAVLTLIPAKMTWVLFSSAAVFGFAYGTCVASQSPLVADLFGLNALGVILGFLSFGFTVGGSFGPVMMGYIFDIEKSYTLAFLLCAGIGLAGLILSGLLKTRSNKV